jgi:hypothetical protein
LLAMRLEIDANDRVRRAAESKRAAETKQRALLSARLEREASSRKIAKEQVEKLAAEQAKLTQARQQPKSKNEEVDLSQRYKAISDLGERAFQILVDLRMVQPPE